MKKTFSKIVLGIATVGLLAATLAPAALAVEISGNGAGSTNGVVVVNSNKCKVTQSSNTAAVTLVSSTANTGGNNAIGNTGGDVTIGTGTATSSVTTTVTGGSNEAVDPCCGCGEVVPAADVVISGNGALSKNGVALISSNSKKVKQNSNTFALTVVKSKAKTGNNNAIANTNGTVGVTTNPAASGVGTAVTGGSNSL